MLKLNLLNRKNMTNDYSLRIVFKPSKSIEKLLSHVQTGDDLDRLIFVIVPNQNIQQSCFFTPQQ